MEPNDILPENSSGGHHEKEQNDARAANNDANQQAMQQDDTNSNSLQAELDACKLASDQWQQRFVQVSADMQNYKRRMEKEQITWTRRAQASVLSELLPIVDDFDRALAEHTKQDEMQDFSVWIAGFEMINKELKKFLKNMHVTEIECSATFDPELHEAVAQVESPDVQSGDIVQVVQKGYMLGEHILRPAKVTVAR